MEIIDEMKVIFDQNIDIKLCEKLSTCHMWRVKEDEIRMR